MTVTTLLIATRPRQWVKNLLVVAAPVAAGQLLEPRVLGATALAFVTFTLAASATYLVNDVLDLAADRQHPTKRGRPLAAGTLTPGVALAAAAAAAVGSVTLAAVLGTAGLVAVILAYLVFSIAYSLGLKRQPVIDLALVASGFLLRAMAGGLAAELPLSTWFLIVAAFGSLFMVAGKRYAELVQLGESASLSRSTLGDYSPSYLRFVWSVSAAVTISAYCLWAFEVEDQQSALPLARLSVVPFVLALLRYAVDVDAGRAHEPEEIALRDHVLQSLAVIWFVLFGWGAFGA